MKNKIYIVAEIGCNHNGDIELAKQMISIAKECGVDAVKFQTFKSEELISKYAPKAEYQIKNTGEQETQLEMTKKLELTYDEYIELEKYAVELGIDIFSTPFDLQSIDFLMSREQKIWKIPSGEILNLPYLEKIANYVKKEGQIIISTGMSSIDEIKACLEVFEHKSISKNRITILHCNTEYPTPYEDVNLNAFNNLKEIFPGYKFGFSDHSSSYYAAFAAIPYGITFIEKHFTLSKDFKGPDHKASLDPLELKELCKGVRIIEKCLGSNKKFITSSERKNRIVARKSIVAKINIRKGEVYTEENLTIKRPGNGISPMKWYEIIGKIAEKDFLQDEIIVDSNIECQEV